MRPKRKKTKIIAYKLFIGVFIVVLLSSNTVFATAIPNIDMTGSPVSLPYILGTMPTNWDTLRSSADTQLWYGPIKISSDIHANTIKMKFKATGLPDQPFVCPDASTQSSWAEKFSLVQLHKVATVETEYSAVFPIIGVDPPNITAFDDDDDIKTYTNDDPLSDGGPVWTKQADGTCTSMVYETGGLATQIDSGWYLLALPKTSVNSNSWASFDSVVSLDNDDTYKISLLGDNTYNTAIVAEGGPYYSGTYSLYPNSIFNGFAPFIPSFPYIEFTYSEPPEIIKEGSCNPFSGELSTFYINTDFSFSDCFRSVLSTLFVPSDGISTRFNYLIEQIKQKPPIGWVVATYDMMTGITIDEAEPAFELEQFVPVQEGIIDPIRTGLSWLLYFIFIVYLFNRFKDIQL